MPKEHIKYQSESNVKHDGKEYLVILTNNRLILYAVRGLIVKKDNVITELLTDIRGITYKETGVLSKTGHILVNCIETNKDKKKNKNKSESIIDLTGDQHIIKELYQKLLPVLSIEPNKIIQEIEIMYCRYCGTKNNARLSNCSACNAPLN
jgi:hypothetical protein